MLIEAIFLGFIVVLLLKILNQKPSDLPPGEWGLPVIGYPYLPRRGKRVSETIKELRAKHGNTFCLKIGSRLLVFLSDFSTIKTALTKPELSGRVDSFSFKIMDNFLNAGIISSDGIVWSTNRKFALRVLKDFGLGNSKLEEIINTEVKNLVEAFKMTVDKPTDIDFSLNVAVLNVIWGLVAGRRFDIKDKEIKTFSKLMTEDVAFINGPAALLDFFPWFIPFLPKIIRKWMTIDKIDSNRTILRGYLTKEVNDHREDFDKEYPRDYIDMYLIEVEKERENPESTFRQDLSDLVSCLLDLFFAGSDTTASSIRWFLLYMAKNTLIQESIHREIDSVVPQDRFPTLEDKEKLPYLEASMHESLRIASLVPFGVPHAAVADTVVDGFRIPKGSTVCPCLSICHRRPDYWERPDEFHPEHFLDENGKFYIRKEGFLPFSIGRRQCLGESLAKMELFLFLGAILQTFKISEPEGQNATLEPNPDVRLMNQPQSFKILLQMRMKGIHERHI